MRPWSEKMFQSALVLRSRLEKRRFFPPRSLMKPRMPCLRGILPVATVVQMTGDQVGRMVLSFPKVPSFMRRVKTGKSPSSIISEMTRHSRPSTPTRIMGWCDSSSGASPSEQATLTNSAMSNRREPARFRVSLNSGGPSLIRMRGSNKVGDKVS